MAPYELFYWPGLQGRGEFVRLLLEDAGLPYVDVARLPKSDGGGVPALQRILEEGEGGVIPYAPPVLRAEGRLVWHAAAILHFVACRHDLLPKDEAVRQHALDVQLTITDVVAEAHNTHHPISTSLYYEDQRDESRAAAQAFVDHRLPKFFSFFERTLARNPHGMLVGDDVSYVDLSLFQVVEGLRYAFPRAMAVLEPRFPAVMRVHDRVGDRPKLKAYLASPRRLAFNEDGIFRRYPDLDVVPRANAED